MLWFLRLRDADGFMTNTYRYHDEAAVRSLCSAELGNPGVLGGQNKDQKTRQERKTLHWKKILFAIKSPKIRLTILS